MSGIHLSSWEYHFASKEQWMSNELFWKVIVLRGTAYSQTAGFWRDCRLMRERVKTTSISVLNLMQPVTGGQYRQYRSLGLIKEQSCCCSLDHLWGSSQEMTACSVYKDWVLLMLCSANLHAVFEVQIVIWISVWSAWDYCRWSYNATVHMLVFSRLSSVQCVPVQHFGPHAADAWWQHHRLVLCSQLGVFSLQIFPGGCWSH